MSIVKFSPQDEGCYINGSWGIFANARLVFIAKILGYSNTVRVDRGNGYELLTLEDIAERHLHHQAVPSAQDITDAESIALDEASDEVEQWLNDNVAPEGYSFGWHDGEFFFQSDEWWEDSA